MHISHTRNWKSWNFEQVHSLLKLLTLVDKVLKLVLGKHAFIGQELGHCVITVQDIGETSLGVSWSSGHPAIGRLSLAGKGAKKFYVKFARPEL